jgi:DNA-binding response OmpR family regulator
MARILFVEDDDALSSQISVMLKHERHVVDAVKTADDAQSNLSAAAYDLVIIDRGLPDSDGISICQTYREAGGSAPILFLTGKSAINEKVEGLRCGGDDYLTKPFHVDELLARVSALLRRTETRLTSALSYCDISMDVDRRRVYKGTDLVTLTLSEFQLLEFLMRNPERFFQAEAIINRIWPADSEATSEAVKTVVKRLRKKLDPESNLIRSQRGFGYALSATANVSVPATDSNAV